MGFVDVIKALGGGLKKVPASYIDMWAPEEETLNPPITVPLDRSSQDELVPGAIGVRKSDLNPLAGITETEIVGTPTVTKKRDWSTFRKNLGNALQAGIVAAGTPNIAGGGGTDIMRAMAAAGDFRREQDAIQRSIARQQEQDRIARIRAESDLARDRAAADYNRARFNQMESNNRLIKTPQGAVLQRNADGSYSTVYAPQTAEQKKAAEVQAEQGRREAVIRYRHGNDQTTPIADFFKQNPDDLQYYATGKWPTAKTPAKSQIKVVDGAIVEVAPGADGKTTVNELRPSKRTPKATAPNVGAAKFERDIAAEKIAGQVIDEAVAKGAMTIDHVINNVTRFYQDDPRMRGGMKVRVIAALKKIGTQGGQGRGGSVIGQMSGQSGTQMGASGGGAQPQGNASALVGKPVKLRDGRTVIVKKINPDGTFEY